MKNLPEKWCISIDSVRDKPDFIKWFGEHRKTKYNRPTGYDNSGYHHYPDYGNGGSDSGCYKSTIKPGYTLITYEQWKEWYYQDKDSSFPEEWLCRSDTRAEAREILAIAKELGVKDTNEYCGEDGAAHYGCEKGKMICRSIHQTPKISKIFSSVSELKKAIKGTSTQTKYAENTALWWFSRIEDPKIRQEAIGNYIAQEKPLTLKHAHVYDAIFTFGWMRTPQGDQYWKDIYTRKNLKLLDKPYYELNKSSNQLKTSIYGNDKENNKYTGQAIVSRPAPTITRGERYTGNPGRSRTKAARITVGYLSNSAINSQ